MMKSSTDSKPDLQTKSSTGAEVVGYANVHEISGPNGAFMVVRPAKKELIGDTFFTVPVYTATPPDARDAARLDWLTDRANRNLRVQGDRDNWSVLDCANGLVFVTRNQPSARAAIDAAIAGRKS